MYIFLQGRSGVGKSTLLTQALAPYVGSVAGFMVQRLMESGRRVGFRAAALEGSFLSLEAQYHPGMDGVFILQGKWDAAALESVIMRVEKQLKNPDVKCILLDEIGGVELASPMFMGALERIFASKLLCLGVLKSRENLAHATAKLKLDSKNAEMYDDLEKKILAAGEIICVTEQNRTHILNHLEAIVAKTFAYRNGTLL